MRYLVLGAGGMAGHTIAIYLSEKKHYVDGFARNPLVFCNTITGDASNTAFLREIIKTGKYNAVINVIGILNVAAEENRHEAVFVNSYLPHLLEHWTKDSSTKIVQISTDCVFSGKTGGYGEHSLTDGETFYDKSKALGELDNEKDLTLRMSIVGPDKNQNGIGLFNWFMKQKSGIRGYTRAFWTGVSTITLARAIEQAMFEDLNGIYNLVNGRKISKFELLQIFNRQMRGGRVEIIPSEVPVIDKSLVNSRKDFTFVVPGYEEMVAEIKTWILSHHELYGHYGA